jgi:hypothetical protein
MVKRVVISSFVVIAACGDNSTQTGPDAGSGSASGPFLEAPHASAPFLESAGGPTLASPKIQPLFFTGDATMQTQIEQFLGMLASSTYWTATTSEYGVGAVTILPTIVETQAAPATDADLQTYLATQLDGHHAGWTYDAQTIYAVYLPTANFTAFGSKACQSFGAFHDEALGQGGISIVYALMPRCMGGVDTLTASSSHEFVEAVTDPYVQTNLAYGTVDPVHATWGIVPGAETGDFCEYVDAAYQRLVGNFVVQRTWSNAAAAAGHDPCVPAPTGVPYMGATPKLLDSTFFPLMGVYTDATTIAMGSSKTIDIQLFTDAASTTPFNVDVLDIFAPSGTGSTPSLTFEWDKQYGSNGDVLHLTITRAQNGPSFANGNVLWFSISTSSSNGRTVGQWWAFVSN